MVLLSQGECAACLQIFSCSFPVWYWQEKKQPASYTRKNYFVPKKLDFNGRAAGSALLCACCNMENYCGIPEGSPLNICTQLPGIYFVKNSNKLL